MDECGAEGAESGLMLGHAWVTTIGACRGVGSDNRARRGKRCCGPPFRPNSHLPSIVLVNMREVISLHVGQAGVQIGNACCKSPSSLISRFFA